MKKWSIYVMLIMATTMAGCSWPRCFSRGDACDCAGYSEPMYDGSYSSGFSGSYPGEVISGGSMYDGGVIQGGMLPGGVVTPQNVPLLPGPVETLPARN